MTPNEAWTALHALINRKVEFELPYDERAADALTRLRRYFRSERNDREARLERVLDTIVGDRRNHIIPDHYVAARSALGEPGWWAQARDALADADQHEAIEKIEEILNK